MSVKDVYGKKVSEQNHMIFAHNPTSMLLNELKNKKMSDREIMEAKGLGSKKSIHNPDLYSKTNNSDWMYSDTKIKTSEDYMPNQRLHRYASFLKSAIRILGYGALWWSLDIGVILLILSEIVGIAEELV